MPNKPTVFNYTDYEKARHRIANLEIENRIQKETIKALNGYIDKCRDIISTMRKPKGLLTIDRVACEHGAETDDEVFDVLMRYWEDAE